MPSQDKGIKLPDSFGKSLPPDGINYLLVIAIDDYEYCPRLQNCVKDA